MHQQYLQTTFSHPNIHFKHILDTKKISKFFRKFSSRVRLPATQKIHLAPHRLHTPMEPPLKATFSLFALLKIFPEWAPGYFDPEFRAESDFDDQKSLEIR